VPMTVASLSVYPVKSLRGHDVPHAKVLREGLANDRRWVITDTSGKLLTQREIRKMAQVTVEVTSNGLKLSHESAGGFDVDTPPAEAQTSDVTVWRFTGPAKRASERAEDWLSTVLERNIWLAHMHDVTVRPTNLNFSLPGDRVSFADGYPILIASSASLVDLNQRGVGGSVMKQFRPNIVVSGAEPWDEDKWRRIRIGQVILRFAKPCERCVVTTLDPQTGEQMPQDQWPLTTLGKFHRDRAGRIMFGQNAIPDELGAISVGDEVKVLERGNSELG
jgi:uncharacterized protein